jgi:hypothetical protein
MIRVTEHTRRKDGGAECAECSGPIEPGERYRKMVQVGETEFWIRPFGCWLAHVACAEAGEYADQWQETVQRDRKAAAERRHARYLVDHWNDLHGGSERIRYWPGPKRGEGKVGTTVGEAFLDAAGQAVVLVVGAGTIHLQHVRLEPTPSAPKPAPPTEDARAD